MSNLFVPKPRILAAADDDDEPEEIGGKSDSGSDNNNSSSSDSDSSDDTDDTNSSSTNTTTTTTTTTTTATTATGASSPTNRTANSSSLPGGNIPRPPQRIGSGGNDTTNTSDSHSPPLERKDTGSFDRPNNNGASSPKSEVSDGSSSTTTTTTSSGTTTTSSNSTTSGGDGSTSTTSGTSGSTNSTTSGQTTSEQTNSQQQQQSILDPRQKPRVSFVEGGKRVVASDIPGEEEQVTETATGTSITTTTTTTDTTTSGGIAADFDDDGMATTTATTKQPTSAATTTTPPQDAEVASQPPPAQQETGVAATVVEGDIAGAGAVSTTTTVPRPPSSTNWRKQQQTQAAAAVNGAEQQPATTTSDEGAVVTTTEGDISAIPPATAEGQQEQEKEKEQKPQQEEQKPKTGENADTVSDSDEEGEEEEEEEEEEENETSPTKQQQQVQNKLPLDQRRQAQQEEQEQEEEEQQVILPEMDYMSEWSEVSVDAQTVAQLKPPHLPKAFWISGSGDALCPNPAVRAIDGALALERLAPAATRPDVPKTVMMNCLRFLGLAEVNILQRMRKIRIFPMKFSAAVDFFEKQLVDIVRLRIRNKIVSSETYTGGGEATIASLGREMRSLGWAAVGNFCNMAVMEWYPSKKCIRFTTLGENATQTMIPLAAIEKNIELITCSPSSWIVKRSPEAADLILAQFHSPPPDITGHEISQCQQGLQAFIHVCVYLSRLMSASLSPPDFRSNCSATAFLNKVMSDMTSAAQPNALAAGAGGISGSGETYDNNNNANTNNNNNMGAESIGTASLLRSRLFCMAANRMMKIPPPPTNQITKLTRPDFGSVPFLWSFSKQDPAAAMMLGNNNNNNMNNNNMNQQNQLQQNYPGFINSANNNQNIGQQVCFSINLSKIRLAGLLTPTELGLIHPSSLHLLCSLVGDNFGVTSPVKIGPCIPGEDGAMELQEITPLFVGATLNDIVYFELTTSNNISGEVKCLGFTSITVAHLVAECLETPAERDVKLLASKLEMSDVSMQHRSLPGQLEAALWLNGGTFFQRKSAPKATRPTGIACCGSAPPAPEASITALITPVTQRSVFEMMQLVQMTAPRLPETFVDRIVCPLGLLSSALKKSPLSGSSNTMNLSAGTSSINMSGISGSTAYPFEQPTINYAVPGTIRQNLVRDTLRFVRPNISEQQQQQGGGEGQNSAAAASAASGIQNQNVSNSEPQLFEWISASKAALSNAIVQPPLFVSSNTKKI